MTHESNPPAGNTGPGYEVRDTNVRGVVTFLVGLTLFVILSQVFLWGVLRGLSPSQPTPPTDAASLGLTPAQVEDLRRTIPRQLRELHEAEAAVLAGKDGLSIDEAMRRLAEKGIEPSAAGLTEADVSSHAGIPASKADATKESKHETQPKDAPK
jgi:hypothetical protein